MAMKYTAPEIETMLDSMTILVDTREQPTSKKYKARVEGFEYPFTRQALNFGDYSCQYVDTNGEIIDFSDRVAIERKFNFNEICGNFTRGREQFANEFQRAKDAGAKLYVIIENETWETAYIGKYGTDIKYRSGVLPQSLIASILTWQSRYNAIFQFCEEQSTAWLISRILKYELREHLENEK